MWRLLVAGCAFALAGSACLAQPSWPDRPMKLVVGFTPGGAADYVGRTVGDALGRVLGQPVIIDNKPGAGSSLAADFVAKSPPDGYTLLIASPSSISVNPSLDAKWIPGVQGLIAVTKLTASPLVIAANAQTGIKSVPELIEFAKK